MKKMISLVFWGKSFASHVWLATQCDCWHRSLNYTITILLCSLCVLNLDYCPDSPSSTACKWKVSQVYDDIYCCSIVSQFLRGGGKSFQLSFFFFSFLLVLFICLLFNCAAFIQAQWTISPFVSVTLKNSGISQFIYLHLLQTCYSQ